MLSQLVAILASMNEIDCGSVEYRELVAAMLQRIDPRKPFGTALYDSIARMSWNLAFEAVALRLGKGGQIEVFLRRRSSDDTAYANQWHMPGSVRRPGETWRQVADRLRGEFGAEIEDFELVGHVDVAEERGSFVSNIFNVGVSGTTRSDADHAWFAIDALPEAFVVHHYEILEIAVKAFKRSTAPTPV